MHTHEKRHTKRHTHAHKHTESNANTHTHKHTQMFYVFQHNSDPDGRESECSSHLVIIMKKLWDVCSVSKKNEYKDRKEEREQEKEPERFEERDFYR